jgi:hypothetical protein
MRGLHFLSVDLTVYYYVECWDYYHLEEEFMKLVTWNSAMRFRDKIEEIFPFEADILVIPECEAPEKWGNSSNLQFIHEFHWFGDNPNKGSWSHYIKQSLSTQTSSFL